MVIDLFCYCPQSFLGFLVFLATVLLRAPPSALLPNRPAAGRKVSVVLVPEDPAPSRLLEYCQQIATGESAEFVKLPTCGCVSLVLGTRTCLLSESL